MKKSLPIGIDNFEDLITNNGYYVDKTSIIEELIVNISKVKLFPRPRRFGKTITLSMIDYYFNKKKEEVSKDLFKGLYIETSEFAKKEKSQFPVITVNFKSVKGDDFEETLTLVKMKLAELYKENKEVYEVLDEDELLLYKNIENETANNAAYQYSLKNLTKYLERYYKEKVIVLIDEYDVPIDNSYHNGFYQDAIKFFRGMYSEVLKTNDSLKFSVMTGVVRVSSESMFSELNHLRVYGITDNHFSEYFGFTDEEVVECLQYYELEDTIEGVRTWYNGYLFGKTKIYNPWSIINYVENEKLKPYWVNTGENLLLKKVLRSGYNSVKSELVKLLNGEDIISVTDENISYRELDDSEETVMTMLLLTGYLTVVEEEMKGRKKYITLRIPNEEVKYEFEKNIYSWLKNIGIAMYYKRFKLAVLEGDYKDMEEVLNEMLYRTVSFHDDPEALYHGIVLCMLIHFGEGYLVKSNREAGYGRYDLTIEAKDGSFGAVLEFKIARTEEELEAKAKLAIEQIESKQYIADLVERNVFRIQKFGIAFTVKQAKVLLG
ncbi:MAG: AAA family ATPase [Eubacteriales bacterium]